MIKLPKKMSKSIRSFIKSHSELKASIEEFKKKKGEITEEEETENLFNAVLVELIEQTFKKSVNMDYMEVVWNYMVENKIPPSYQKAQVNREVEKWQVCLAYEIYMTRGFKKAYARIN